MSLTDEQLENEIRILEERKSKIMKLQRLQEEVAALETQTLRAPLVLRKVLSSLELEVCSHYGVGLIELKSRARFTRISDARQLIFFLARKITMASLASIGSAYDRDHGTVLHAVEAVQGRIETDRKFAAYVKDLEAKVRGLTGTEIPSHEDTASTQQNGD